MKNKDLIMFGLIIGIALFFVGMMIHNVFPSTEENLLSYKVSAFMKLVGLGVLTSSMVIGGVLIEDIDRNLKMLLLIFGLLLLLIYSIGSTTLEWSIPEASGSESGFEERPTGYGIPGFEGIFFVLSIVICLLVLKRKKLGYL